MSVFSAIGIILLILLGIVLICLAVVWMEKRFPGKNHDERQEQSQGKAFRLSFGAGLLYYGFVTVLLMAQQKQGHVIEPYLLVFGGIILQVTVFRIYCMITQSFMRTYQKPSGALLFDLVMGLIALQMFQWSRRWDILKEMGYPVSFEWIFLILAVMFFFFACCWLCQVLHQRLRREKE